MRLVLVGHTGFIGRAISTLASERGWTVIGMPGLRVVLASETALGETIDRWARADTQSHDELFGALENADVVINAGGLAEPTSRDSLELLAANAALPAIVIEAAARAGVRRVVHLSSAAVQGRRDPLDETLGHAPFSPYSYSKAVGESLVAERSSLVRELVIYRPTSVQGNDRGLTLQLRRMSALPLVPVVRGGNVPLPVTLIGNVAAAALHLAEVPVEGLRVALHPWEGMTTRTLIESLVRRPRFLTVPLRAAKGFLAPAHLAAAFFPTVAARKRRIELLWFGQGQHAYFLPGTGFRPPLGIEGYRALADAHRETAG